MLRFVTRFLYACDKLHVTWLRFEKKTAYKFAGGGGGGRLSVQRLFTYEVNSVERGDPEAGCSISVVLSRAINRGEIARVGSMELNKVTRKGIIELANQP